MAINIPRGYVPNKPMKEIEKDFRKGGYGSVDNFINKNFTLETADSGKSNIPVTPPNNLKLKSESFQYLNDNGNGRISSGVASLEGITKVLKGVPIHALTLFDQVIYTDPTVFRSNDKIILRQEVYQNLGMVQFIPAAQKIAPTSVSNLDVLVDLIIKDVKNLTFLYDNYINSALVACKGVVRAAVKGNGI